jgi:hypothetical protein
MTNQNDIHHDEIPLNDTQHYTTTIMMELTITLSIKTLDQIETLSTTVVILNYVMLTAKMLSVGILSAVASFWLQCGNNDKKWQHQFMLS